MRKSRGTLERLHTIILNTQAYARLHNVFHVSLLEAYKKGSRVALLSLPPPELIGESEEYAVEKLEESRQGVNETEYLVKWKGWPKDYNKWVEKSNIAKTAVEAYTKRISKATTTAKKPS